MRSTNLVSFGSWCTSHSLPRYTVWCPKDRRRSWIKRCLGHDWTSSFVHQRCRTHGFLKSHQEGESVEPEPSCLAHIHPWSVSVFNRNLGFAWSFEVSHGIPTQKWPASWETMGKWWEFPGERVLIQVTSNVVALAFSAQHFLAVGTIEKKARGWWLGCWGWSCWWSYFLDGGYFEADVYGAHTLGSQAGFTKGRKNKLHYQNQSSHSLFRSVGHS